MNKTTKQKYESREAWLQAAVALMVPLFKSAGHEVPILRVSCGWPSSRALSQKKRVLGEAWPKDAASDKVAQIFISPWLIKTADEQGVLPTLAHEVVHATVGNENKHNKVFGKCARAIGLEGKLTSTNAGKLLMEAFNKWEKQLGAYPHAKLDMLKRPVKKQTTRMVKCECKACGYVARVSRKWLEEAGAPGCPQHGVMAYEIPEDLEDDMEGEGNQ
jgi:hypothetical protein